jgi:hypothetical protein
MSEIGYKKKKNKKRKSIINSASYTLVLFGWESTGTVNKHVG